MGSRGPVPKQWQRLLGVCIAMCRVRSLLQAGHNQCPEVPPLRRAGIGYVPADRKSQGLVLSLPIQQSLSLLVLRELNRLGIVARCRERTTAQRLAQEVKVRSQSLNQTVGELSGGNQQKVLVGVGSPHRPKSLYSRNLLAGSTSALVRRFTA